MNSYNYSAISTYRRCQKLYQHVYVDKLKPEVGPSGDLKFGSAIHIACQSYLEGDDGIKAFNVFWDMERSNPNQYGRYGWADLKNQGEILLDKFERFHLKKFKVYQTEQRLYGQYLDISLEGTPDFLGEFEGKKSVVDFKTSGSNYHKDKIKVAEQLMLYAYLALTSQHYKVDQLVYFVFVKGPKPSIQTPIILDVRSPLRNRPFAFEIEDVYHTVKEITQAQDKNLFAKNRASCIMGSMTCDFFKRCHGGT